MKSSSQTRANGSETQTERCPNCGRKVTMPCLACQINKLETVVGWKNDGFDESGEVGISLELRKNELGRYQQVRSYRDKYGVPMFGDEHDENESN